MKNLYWIDDEYKKRKPTGPSQRALVNGLGVNFEAPPFPNHKAFAEFMTSLHEDTTYGVLMDYKLTNVGAQSSTEYGTTWAAQLRAIKPSIPIVGVSFENEKEVPKFRIENFLAFFKRSPFHNGKPPVLELKSLFDGYSLIWEAAKTLNSGTGLELIMKLVKAPEAVAELLKVAVPSTLRGRWDDETPHAATRWVWHQLQGEPGFLFDEFEAATFLGLKQAAFSEYASIAFASARYSGALACEDRPRWWVCQIREAAEKQIGERLVGPVAQSRDKLLLSLGVGESEIAGLVATPYGRKGSVQPAECVAYRDQDSKNEGLLNARVPALLKDTIIDEADANPPFGFQARRHFKLDDSE